MILSIKELLTKSFEVYQSRAFLMGVLMIVPALISFGVAAFLAPFLVAMPLSGFNVMAMFFGVLAVLIIILVSLVVYFLSHVALFYSLKTENVNVSIQTIKDLLEKSFEIVGGFAWTSFLGGLIVLLGFILLIIPGIIFSIWFSFASYIVVFEGLRGMKALNSSKVLVQGYWWPVFGRMLVFLLAGIVVSMIPLVGDALSLLCVTPFGVIYMNLMYEDLKKIKGVSGQLVTSIS